MYKKFFLLFILLLSACVSKEYVRDIAGHTLHDNENLLYDNYRYTVFSKKQYAVDDAKSSSIYDEDISCVYSCVSRPLRVAVVPMGFARADALEEIKNTVALVRASQSLQNYNIKVLDGENVSHELLEYSPDIIIGPFTDEDLKELQKHMMGTNTNVPVISLTKGRHSFFRSSLAPFVMDIIKNNDKPMPVYKIGYNAEDDIRSVMDVLSGEGYTNFAMFAVNDDIGASLYRDFKNIADSNGQDISRVEFYEEDLNDIDKYIARLKKSTTQTYYENIDTGRVKEDTHSFTQDIEKHSDDIVTTKDGKQYYKKYRTLDAMILDASSAHFSAVMQRISQDDILKNIPIIASPRSVSVIVDAIGDAKHVGINNIILLPLHYVLYSTYYNVYKNTFHTKPTRVSSTLYEALLYMIKSNERKDIKDHSLLNTLPVFVGLNGTLVLGKEESRRFVNITKIQNGNVIEVVDTYKNSR